MKNRARIIGLAVAGVAGTSGAAFAGMQVHDEPSTQPVIEDGTTSTESSVAGAADGTVTYQVGAAGTVAVTRTAGSLSVSSATAGAGWSVLAMSGPGSHVEVQFTDTFQVVTFGADAVGDDISVSLSNVAAPGAETTTMPAAPIDVQIIGSAPGTTNAPWPQPATPAPTSPTTPHSTNAPGTSQPGPATTAAPSSGGDDDDDDDHEDEHEDDHEDEDEGDDD